MMHILLKLVIFNILIILPSNTAMHKKGLTEGILELYCQPYIALQYWNPWWALALST